MTDIGNKEKGVDDDIIDLLKRLSTSLEKTVDSINIQDFSSLCWKCCNSLEKSNLGTGESSAEKCDCTNGEKPVEKRDCCIQTSPLFEICGSLPHIDSDEDENFREKESDELVKNASGSCQAVSTGKATQTSEILTQPRFIKELPRKILTSGIQLPGTFDTAGRPLIIINKTAVIQDDVPRSDIAKVLMYFATLLQMGQCLNDSDGEVVILLVTDADSNEDQMAAYVGQNAKEKDFFDLLDEVLCIVDKYLKVHVVLSWNPESSKSRQCQTPLVFPRSNIKYLYISEECILHSFISSENLPRPCGGKSACNVEEWIDFFEKLEAFTTLCRDCGHHVRDVMTDISVPVTSKAETEGSRICQQQKAIIRAFSDKDLEKFRKEGSSILSELEEQSLHFSSNLLIRRHLQLSKRLYREVNEAVDKLQNFFEKRQQRIKEITRLQALKDELNQMLSWITKIGEPGLKKQSEIAASLHEIKKQEHDFETFYFNGMRHLEKGNDLLEETTFCIEEEERRFGESQATSDVKGLANTLKSHLKEFAERLENTREKLEDTCRCFYLLDKIYDWSLETSKYINRLKLEDCASEEIANQLSNNIHQKISNHPHHIENYFLEISALMKKLNDEKLKELFRVAQARYGETAEAIRNVQTRLMQDGDFNLSDRLTGSILDFKSSKDPGCNFNFGRRKSLGSFPYIFKCSHHAEGSDCSCDSGFVRDPFEADDDSQNRNRAFYRCDCTSTRLQNVDDVSTEKCGNWECSTCKTSIKMHLRRTCTWQYPTEKFDDYDRGSNNSSRSEESDLRDLEEQEGIAGNFSVPTSATVNSHLYRHASDLSLDLLDSGDGKEDAKSRKTLLLIMREMVQTEKDYVKSLEYVVENYIPELLREDIPQALRGQRNVIFGNIEKIYEFHSHHFLQELKNHEKNPCSVGQCFLRHEKKFYLYALYNKNKPKSDSLMTEYGSAFFKNKQKQLEDKMDLASYLLKPVQRMGKYALLLQQLMKALGPKDSYSSELAAAEAMVRFQLRHGNDLLAMDSLRECDVNLKEQGRLLRQNEFIVWQGKGKKCLRHVFLFEELILFSKAKRFPDKKNLDIYIYKNSIKTTDIGLTAKIGDSPTKFEIWYRKRKPNDTYTLQSMSEETKQEWIKELSTLLWKQALRNREMRLQEMTSMGIGNKPCLDIRPSSDQISDRSVSAARLLTKSVAKIRSSMGTATSTPGFLGSIDRPHSIISVISSSSSSSGSSSFSSSSRGSTSSISHTADSPTFPRSSSRSRCSTESGIVADISMMPEELGEQGTTWQLERPKKAVPTLSSNSSATCLDETISSSDKKTFKEETTEI